MLRLSNGQEYPLSPVTIPVSDLATVDVSQELANLASPLAEQAGTYGSVVFKFAAPFARSLYAAIMIHEMGQPIGYHVDAYPMDPEYLAGAREGIWWMPRSTTKDALIIANGDDQPNQGRLVLYDASGKSWQQNVQLGPRQAVRLVVGDLVKQAGFTGTYGGFRFEVAKRRGSIDSLYFLYDETTGFSALMKMFDHNPATTLQDRLFAGSPVWKTWAPMLALQNTDPALTLPSGTQLQPRIFLRNTSNTQQVATVKLTHRGDSRTGTVTLPLIRLKPNQTQLVDVLALQQAKKIPPDAHWALVEISSAGSPDDIMAIASSFDSTGRYGSQTPFSDQLSDHWVAGKFEVDSTHNSLISVTNAGKKPTEAVLTFHYNHGQNEYEIRRTIAAGDQLWLNMGDLIRNQLPDIKGRTLPADLTSGTYEIREPDRNNDPSIFEGKIIVDKTYGHLAYGCTTCCGDGYPAITADPDWLEWNASNDLYVVATNSCTGYEDDLTGQFSGWGTDNSSIATMNSNLVTGVGVGSAHASSSGTFNYNNGVSKYCTVKKSSPRNTTNVQPTITGPSTVWWFNGENPPGYNTSVTLTSSGGSSTTWSITAGSDKVRLSSTAGASVTVTSTGTAWSAASGDIGIAATTNSVPSTTFAMTSRRPYLLEFPQFLPNCDQYFGYRDSWSYQILDQLAIAMPAMVDWNELFTSGIVDDNVPFDNWSIYGLPQQLPGYGTYLVDEITGPGLNNNPPPIPTPNCNGLGTQIQHWGQEFRIGTQAIGHGQRVQKDSLTRFINHAEHDAQVSPAP